MYAQLRLTPEKFKSGSRKMGKKIYQDYNEKSILYFAMETGGRDVGRHLEDCLSELLEGRLRVYPVERDRKNRIVKSPTEDVVIRDSLDLRAEYNRGVIALGYDDVIATGLDMLILYGFLLGVKDDARFDDIALSSFMDKVGFTDYCWINLARRHIDKNSYYLMAKEKLASPGENVMTDWTKHDMVPLRFERHRFREPQMVN